MRTAWLGRIVVGALALSCLATMAATAAAVPSEALRYRAQLTRTARAVWGMDAPVAAFAGQVHQESAWNPGAVSRVGAAGMAQFMPGTSRWIVGIYPDLADEQPYNPAWALRALVTYDLWIYQRTRGATSCDRFAMALSGYNGGLGWVQRDQAAASGKGLDPLRWWDSVETVNAGRTAANWRENRDYPRRILLRHQPLYFAAGWGAGMCP